MRLDVTGCVDAVLARVGQPLRIATPLGIGKPNHLLNAFYRRAQADASLGLELMTALSLQKPVPRSELERRFLTPFLARLLGDCPELDYERDRDAGHLPDNVRVFEFYLQAGKYLGNAAAQQDYISTNYTHVARDLAQRGVNVVVQEVCRGTWEGKDALSLSCNADLTLELVAELRKRGGPFVLCAQVNQKLPFMTGEALVSEEMWDLLVDEPAQYHDLFATPKAPVSDAEYLIGLYASTLVQDGGSLQIGIGALGDALAYALILRHERNDVYREVLSALHVLSRFGDEIARTGDLGTFQRGLFAPTEMLVDGFMHLMEAGILKREVYDDLAIERWLDRSGGQAAVSLSMLDGLLELSGFGPVLDATSFGYLQHWGVLQPELRLQAERIALDGGLIVPADMRASETRQALQQRGLGVKLRHGRVAHAGFFLGSPAFYAWLRALPEAERARIDMRGVTRINQLYGHQPLDALQRRQARFINTGMMVTLGGAVVSDGLENGQVVSGVGGQYNFVAMAHALPGARSILQIRSTRHAHGSWRSNVVASYGHITIPRHLRDIVVTEHGIADLRGKTDQEVIQALLATTDARFQAPLLAQAKDSGKLAAGWQIPALHAANHADRCSDTLDTFRRRGLFPRFPFGTEMTPEEGVLSSALRQLANRLEHTPSALRVAGAALVARRDARLDPYLERMDLLHPRSMVERTYQRLLSVELRNVLNTQHDRTAK